MGATTDTLLVTGGAGFIGCNFVRLALAETDFRVVVVDKLTYAGNLASLRDCESNERYRFERADIADAAAVERIFSDHDPAVVVNFAAESHVDRSIDGPRAFIESNIVGAFELLDAARRHLADAPAKKRERFRFIQVSTDEVFGALGETGLFTETTPYDPNSPYSASKAAADHIARAYQRTYGLPVLITNCSNNYGPYQFPEKLIPLMILNALDGRELPIYGDGGNVRDWLYVEDHCAGILTVIRKGKPGASYNIGGGNERTNLEIVDAICARLEEIVPAAENPALAGKGISSYADLKKFVPDRPGHDRRYAIDSTLIRTELGWKARHAFDDGLALTVRWYVDNREWCSEVQRGSYDRQRLGLGAGTKD